MNWVYLGNKREFADTIEKVTRINRSVLLKKADVLDQSVSCRMSWAAHRHTTRTEDQAYSLMGIFNVNMPLLYGEGRKAFHRLQEEIIKVTSDHSILLHSEVPQEQSSYPNEWPPLLSWTVFDGGQRFRKSIGSLTSHLQIQSRRLSISLLVAPLELGYTLGILESGFVDDPTNLSRPAIILENGYGLRFRADYDILRVTPVDAQTANVKSVNENYTRNCTSLEIYAPSARFLVLVLTQTSYSQLRLT
jgi:hypothetical protein